jgi:hypothetical protein
VRLTKPSSDEAPSGEGGSEGGEGEVDVGPSLVAQRQAPELLEPGQGAFHHPPVPPIDPAPGDAGLDA